MANPLAQAVLNGVQNAPTGNRGQAYAGRANIYAPPGSVGTGWGGAQTQTAVGLPRPLEVYTSGDFSPLEPLFPVPIDIPEGPNGKPRPRRMTFPVGFNLPIGQPGTEGIKLANFQQLRDLAEIPSVARTCIEICKGDLTGVPDWDIIPTDEAAAAMKGNPGKAKDFEKRKDELMQFFANPDPNGHTASTAGWLNVVLEDNIVLDAVALYIQPAGGKGNGPCGSDIGALVPIDGSMVKPLLDEWGGQPRPPAPAYQVVQWQVPRVDLMDIINLGPGATIEEYKALNPFLDQLTETVDQWTGSQLIYYKANPRVWTPYGYSPTEQAIIPISLLTARQSWQMEFYRAGSLPQVFMDPGESVTTPEEAQELMQAMNQLGGDLANMWQVIVTPPGAKIAQGKTVDLTSAVDEWFTSLIVMPYGLSISDLGITPKVAAMQSPAASKGAARTAVDRSTRRSTLPRAKKLKAEVFDRLIQGKFGQLDMQWSWGILEQGDSKSDQVTQAVSLFAGSISTLDEARIAVDLDPLNTVWSTTPIVFLPTGAVPLGTPPVVPGTPPAGGAVPSEKPEPGSAAAVGEQAKPKPSTRSAQSVAEEESPTQAGQAEVGDNPEDLHSTAEGNAAKALELRQLRRYLSRGGDLDAFQPRALRAVALKAAKGTPDPAQAALKVGRAQRHMDHRDAALAPIRAGLVAGLAKLVARYHRKKPPDPTKFAPAAVPILAQAYQDAFTAGAGAGAADWGDAAGSPDPTDIATERAQSMTPYLRDLALGIVAGQVSQAQSAQRVQSYGDSATAPYEQGYVASAPPDKSGIVWHLGDAVSHCSLCEERDGQTFTEADLPGFPGDGDYGGPVCEGGSACVCSLEMVDTAGEPMASTQTPSIARQTTQGTEPTWASKSLAGDPRSRSKEISLGSPLGSGLVPFDLSGPDGRRAPNNVEEREKAVPLAYPPGSGDGRTPGGNGPVTMPMRDQNDQGGQAEPSVNIPAPKDAAPAGAADAPSCAGLALRAADTGRILMLQRALDDHSDQGSNPLIAGKWELPGGHLEAGETPEAGAAREWEEEVGTHLPDDVTWVSTWGAGVYVGFVAETEHEAAVDINQGEGRAVANPDGDSFEACAWFSPADLPNTPLRLEVQNSLPALTKAIVTPALKSKGGSTFVHKGPLESKVHDYVRKHYPEDTTGWVCRSSWEKSKVPLDAIAFARRPGGRDEDKVAKMAAELKDGKKPKRVVVVDQGTAGKMVVADGYHRLAAMERNGDTEARAWVGTPRPGAGDWKADIKAMQREVLNKSGDEDADSHG